MLLVETRLLPSRFEGYGVFAAAPIPAGAPVWELDLEIDRLIGRAYYESLTGAKRSYLDRYCYPYAADPGFIVLDGDDARYMNHSDAPNCDFSAPDRAVALTDIAALEELTCDYRVFFPEGFEFLGGRHLG